MVGLPTDGLRVLGLNALGLRMAGEKILGESVVGPNTPGPEISCVFSSKGIDEKTASQKIADVVQKLSRFPAECLSVT